MSILYTLIAAENLGDDQVRKVRAYEVPGAGVALNVQVELTIEAPYRPTATQIVIDEEVFIPDITTAALVGRTFSTVDTLDLGEGQKRFVRQLTLASGGKVTSVVATVDAKQGAQTKTFVKSEELYYHAPVPTAPSYLGAKPMQGSWLSDTQVTFASRPGHPAKNELVLPDGKLRSMTGPFTWDAARLVNPHLGYDHQDSIDGGNKWLWWYIIPMPGSDALMTVVASERPPSLGPYGQSLFKVCWVSRRIGGDILKVQQTGNRFDHLRRIIYSDYDVSDESSFTSVSLEDFVPETASIARLRHSVASYGTQDDQDRWTCYICSTASTSDVLNVVAIRSPWDIQRTPKEITEVPSHTVPGHTVTALPSTHASYASPAIVETTRTPDPNKYMTNAEDSFEAVLFGSRTVYKRRDRYAGGQNALYLDGLRAYGWLDAWIEP